MNKKLKEQEELYSRLMFLKVQQGVILHKLSLHVEFHFHWAATALINPPVAI